LQFQVAIAGDGSIYRFPLPSIIYKSHARAHPNPITHCSGYFMIYSDGNRLLKQKQICGNKAEGMFENDDLD